MIPLTKSTIPISVCTKTCHQPLPKAFPSAKGIFRIDGITLSTDTLFANA